MTEKWKYIPKTNKLYKISNFGNILSMHTNKLMNPYIKHKEKLFIKLTIEKGKCLERSIDKLVIEAFVRKLKTSEVIIHKDENPNNNRLDNLIIKNKNEPKYIREPPKQKGEEWKYIPEYENRYMASNQGRVYSQLTNEILILYIGEIGYQVVNLISKNKKRNLNLVHIIIAKTFIGEIKSKQVVDHIDRNKLNNKLANLRIVTQNQNAQNREFKSVNIIEKYDLNGNFIKEYDSIEEIRKDLGFEPKRKIRQLYACLNGQGKTAFGYIWKYKNKEKNVSKDDNFVQIKIIDGYDLSDYMINKFGQVKSNKTDKILKPHIEGGYENVCLMPINKKKSRRFRLHRLLICTFGPENTDNKKVVNHIDENKLNNNLDNLEWATEKENSAHSRGKAINQIDLKTGKVIETFKTINEAYSKLKIKYGSNIRMVCNGERQSAYGYKWEWNG